jgi:hypothetical protein
VNAVRIDATIAVLHVLDVIHSHTDGALLEQGAPPVTAGARPALRLSISADDLVLEGRFDSWSPVALDGSTADAAAAQLFLDVTGTAPADADELFSFRSRSVERLSETAYLARGSMKRGEVEHSTHAVIQTPVGHTPFLMITFNMDRTQQADIWDALSSEVKGASDPPATARAWLRPPVLAAA